MRFPQLSFAASAGALAAIGATTPLTICAQGGNSTTSGAHMLDDSLLLYQVKATLDQDITFSTCRIRIRSNPDGKVTLTGRVDTPGMIRRASEDVKCFVDPAKLDNQLYVFSCMQVLGGGPHIPVGLLPEAPASAPAAC